MHWATDTMMGAFVGTAMGAGLPFSLHRPLATALVPAAPDSEPALAPARAVA
jgi:hypothetical protein